MSWCHEKAEGIAKWRGGQDHVLGTSREYHCACANRYIRLPWPLRHVTLLPLVAMIVLQGIRHKIPWNQLLQPPRVPFFVESISAPPSCVHSLRWSQFFVLVDPSHGNVHSRTSNLSMCEPLSRREKFLVGVFEIVTTVFDGGEGTLALPCSLESPEKRKWFVTCALWADRRGWASRDDWRE